VGLSVQAQEGAMQRHWYRFDKFKFADGGIEDFIDDAVIAAGAPAVAWPEFAAHAQTQSFMCGCPGCAGNFKFTADAINSTLSDTVTTTGGTSISALKPEFTLKQIVDQLQTQWSGSYEGSTMKWAGTNVSYAIPVIAPPDGGNGEAAGFVNMTAHMRTMARTAFELWDDLIAINLNETNSIAADITFAYSSRTNDDLSYARPYLSGSGTNYTLTNDDIWLSTSYDTLDKDIDIQFGKRGFSTYLHEIGHSLGLSHAGSYNAAPGVTISFAADAEFAQDNRGNTLMSYFGSYRPGSGWQQDGAYSDDLFGATPMLYDIAAIQAKYGADMTTRTGNTVYGFSSTAGRDLFDFTKNPTPIFAIWDAAGIDKLDCSGYFQDQLIDLKAGALSSVGGMTQNVGIAFGCIIENATGGWGNDKIFGNDADNTLIGNAGNDELNGGEGRDYFNGGTGSDTVDFSFTSLATTVNLKTGQATWAALPRFFETLISIENVTTGAGDDTLRGSDGDNILNGGAGRDYFDGGLGSDTVDYSFIGIATTVNLATGQATWETAPGATETLVSIENARGGSGKDNLTGNALTNRLEGNAGSDVLYGAGGADFMFGGADADRFVFKSASESRPGMADTIADLNIAEGDRIDLSAIDANPFMVLDQAFTLGGGYGPGLGIGQLVIRPVLDSDGEFTIRADITGDSLFDLDILVHQVTGSWNDAFLL
jgi:Ca2+-binding RTX toxin-like protein